MAARNLSLPRIQIHKSFIYFILCKKTRNRVCFVLLFLKKNLNASGL